MFQTNTHVLSDDDCVIFKALKNSAWHNYCYIPITKVASTYLRQALPGKQLNINNWQWYSVDNNTNIPCELDPMQINWLVVLRDPVQRWISGATQYWSRHIPNRDWSGHIEHWLFDTIDVDIHTRPQVDFLFAINPTNTTWLSMQHNVENHSWFSDHQVRLRKVDHQDRNRVQDSLPIYYQGETRYQEPRSHTTASTPAKVIYDAISAVLEKPVHLDRIKCYYQKDYDLINSVQFEVARDQQFSAV